MTSKMKDSTLIKRLPYYRNPPINEVVCGMRIHPADNLLIPHIGLLWDKFRAEYPRLQHTQPLATTKGEIAVDKVTKLPIPRIWFISNSDDQLIQFQNDRFYFNWRKRKNDYPRYKNMMSNFEIVFRAVKALFNEFELGELEPIEYELTYLNHIPRGNGWETIDDLSNIFSDFHWNKSDTRFLHHPKEVGWAADFSFPDQKGHLSISLKQGIRILDELPILIFELKAMGFDSEDSFRNWFDLAHEWIVRGFTDLTIDKMHEFWGVEKNV